MTPLVRIAAATADPETALPRLEEGVALSASLADDEAAQELIAHLYAGSDPLSAWLARRPEDIDWLVEDERLLHPRDREAMRTHLAELMDAHPPDAALRIFRSRELARIAARELSGVSSVETALAEWSAVADVAVDAACAVASGEMLRNHGEPVYTPQEGGEERRAGFAVIGMGKHGGEELNISSDIDVIYVHSSDNGESRGGAKGGLSLHEYFVRIARRVTQLLHDHTDLGQVFRVDLDLRPEGKSGEMTNSVGAMEIYYESWGQMWERQAFIKARHVGGDRTVSAEVLDRLRPFTWRKYLDKSSLDEVAVMKDKIDAQLKSKKTAKKEADNIKLGLGGIREIEFVAQALQLLWGAHYPELTTVSTLTALDGAAHLGLLSHPHYSDLKESYLFYRRLENRIQYHQLSHTHHLPESDDRRTTLGRQMGFDEDPAASLVDEVARRRRRVRRIFDLFFQRDATDQERFPVPLEEDELEDLAEWLDGLRFNQPTSSARQLIELKNGRPFTHPSEKSRRLFDSFGPTLVAEAASTPWPDNVLIGFSQFIETKGARDAVYEMLDNNRSVITLLSAIFAASESLTATLVRSPDLLDSFLVTDLLHLPGDQRRNRARFVDILEAGKSVEETLARMSHYKAYESLRLGLARILGKLTRFDVMEGLTLLAESYLTALMELSRRRLDEEGTLRDIPPYALVACGKMARREMNFGSDLDLILFHDGDIEGGLALIALFQAAIKMSKDLTPFGAGYEIDLRLRPEGEGSPMATPLVGAQNYYDTRAETWERLALVGARPVAGDPTCHEKVNEMLGAFVHRAPLTPDDITRLAAIRERIAGEKVKGTKIDIKFGRGGLIEIEFVAQILLMEHPDHPLPTDRGVTFATIEEAGRKKWLTRDEVTTLKEAYVIYRSIEDALRMDRVKPVNTIPTEGPDLLRTARRAALPGVGPDRFLETVKETKSNVRAIYDTFMRSRKEG